MAARWIYRESGAISAVYDWIAIEPQSEVEKGQRHTASTKESEFH